MEVAWKISARSTTFRFAARAGFDFGHRGRPIAVFRTTESELFALIDECPHRRGPLSEGIVSGHTVTCPLHNWVIGLSDGRAFAPDEGRTVTLPVRVVAGEVYVGVPLAVGATA